MNARATALAIAALFSSPALAGGPEDLSGRWIRECGDGAYCRLLVDQAGDRFELTFVLTSPPPPVVPPPDTEACEWKATLSWNADATALQGKGGLRLRADGTGRLALSGAPATCGESTTSGTFDRDDVDEFSDF